jgi:homoserine O-succinyltransferase
MDMMPPDDPALLIPPAALARTPRVGLINNMPDPALARTEQQFRGLLSAALGGHAVELVMVTLPQIARADWAARHVAETYLDVAAFQAADLDAVVVTGAEPRAARLCDEPYWAALTALFDWIEESRMPAAYCCLAAHAAVLHRDGIERRPLAAKCSGVFPHRAVPGHPFSRDLDPVHVLPHSRWNEITEADLAAHGYATLSRSDAVGVGAFARAGGGVELFFQGHPEYASTTLLREYRRDVRRYLTREREVYPEPPFDSIHGEALAAFAAFRERALRQRDAALFEEFPAFTVADARASPWRPAATRIYGRWLEAALPGVGARAGALETVGE